MSTVTRLGRRTLVWSLLIIVVLIAALPPAHSQDPVLQKFESDDALIVADGTWFTQPAVAASGGSYRYNTPTSVREPATLSLQFFGPSVEIHYVAGPTLGTLAIEIDGVVLRTVMTTQPEVAYDQSARIAYLSNEPHTLRVYAQAGDVIGVDAFVAAPIASTTQATGLSDEMSPRIPTCQPDTYPQFISFSETGAPFNEHASISGNSSDISADGRYVAFLVGPRYAWDHYQTYVRDRIACTTTLVSVNSNGIRADGNATQPSISGDGRYVTFISGAPNLATPPVQDYQVFMRDLQTQTTTLVSSNANGDPANGGGVTEAVVSDNGRYVAFISTAWNLVDNYPFWGAKPYVRDLQTGEYRVAPPGVTGCFFCGSSGVDISADGRYVTYAFFGQGIPSEIYAHDFQTNTTVLVSTSLDPNEVGESMQPAISGNGRYVVFVSEKQSLVPDDTNGRADVFVRDLATNTTTRVNIRSDGTTINADWIEGVTISGDGRYVGFTLDGSSFIRDQQTGETYLATMRDAHTYLLGPSFNLHIAANAPVVAFRAYASNIVAGDTSDEDDVFVNAITPAPLPTNTETLALINPTTRQISLIDTVADPPPANTYTTFTANPRASGRWVMGDWDGDGDKTPGVYEDSGAFMFTNDLGPNAVWGGIWFGLMGRPPVIGHFEYNTARDCLGVMDSAEFPPYGTGFALYFTCDLTHGPVPPLQAAWLGIPMQDDPQYQGDFQFAAGGFVYAHIDGIAIRRGQHIVWSYFINPQHQLWFDDPQAWTFTFPSNDYGVLVAGDWNNDGIDTLGFVFQNGDFVWRNDLQLAHEFMSAGWIITQHAGQPVGGPIQAASWR